MNKFNKLRSNRMVMGAAVVGGISVGLILLLIVLKVSSSGSSVQASADPSFSAPDTLAGARAGSTSVQPSSGGQAEEDSGGFGLKLPSFPGKDFPVLGRLFGGDEEPVEAANPFDTPVDASITQAVGGDPAAEGASGGEEPAASSAASGPTLSPELSIGIRNALAGPSTSETTGSGGDTTTSGESDQSNFPVIIGPDGKPLEFEGSPFSSFGDATGSGTEGSEGSTTDNSVTASASVDGGGAISTSPFASANSSGGFASGDSSGGSPFSSVSSGGSGDTSGGSPFSSFTGSTGGTAFSSADDNNFGRSISFSVSNTSQLVGPTRDVPEFPEAEFMPNSSVVVGEAMFGEAEFEGSDDLKAQIKSVVTSEWVDLSLAAAEVFTSSEDEDILAFYRKELEDSGWTMYADIGPFGHPIMYMKDSQTLVVAEMPESQMQSLGVDSDGFALLLFDNEPQ